MKAKAGAKAPQEAPPRMATPDEVHRALASLSEADLVRLAAYAQNRISAIGPFAAHGRDRDDLLQEAATRLLDGRRNWYPERVDIVKYLIRVIESIASEWASHRKRNRSSPEYASLESEVSKKDDEGQLISPFAAVPAAGSNVEEQIIDDAESKALADEIEKEFADDEPAGLVLLAWQSGMKGPQIQKDLGWTETEYRTTVRRIQRRAQKIGKGLYGR
jgi:RNA polymerase sigma factor (sigma-70 family)